MMYILPIIKLITSTTKRKKPQTLVITSDLRLFNLAGAERIELPPKVLETPIIPFDQAPIFNISTLSSVLYIICHKYLKYEVCTFRTSYR